jgi:hypothetical protein
MLTKIYTEGDFKENDSKFYKIPPIVHNHLPNNFLLGNKKALFLNLKRYFELKSRNVFEIVPLTFHIKHGLSDPSYKNFVKYYCQI